MADRKFTTLRELLAQKGRINLEAASSGHDAYLPTTVRVQTDEGKIVTRGPASPTPSKEVVGRGRILLFLPTKEKVTIIREKVGRSYNGDWLHEVTTREGHTFLALQKQLKDSVK